MRLQDANRILPYLIHDLRTPLSSILGYAELLSAPDDADPKSTRDYAARIRRNARQLLDLVEGLLDAAQFEAGRFELRSRRVPLVDQIYHILSPHEVEAERKRLAFQVWLEGELPEEIEVDPLRLEQVVSNVVGNALKFTDSGHVRVRVGFAARAASGGGTLCIEVSDTGTGVPAGADERIFEPYERCNESHREVRGSGIGLSLARQVARAMGGDVSLLRTGASQGCTFTIRIEAGCSQVYLPPSTAMARYSALGGGQRGIPRPSAAGGESLRFLVVSETDGAIERLTHGLSKLGALVQNLGSEEEVAAHLQRAPQSLPLVELIPLDSLPKDLPRPRARRGSVLTIGDGRPDGLTRKG